MYKLKKTNLLIAAFLLLSMQVNTINTFSFRNSFKDMFEEMDHTFKHMQHGFKTKFHKNESLSAEDQKLVNKQLEIIAKIKPEITKSENGLVSIMFPIDSINKDKIELSLEHGLLHGILPLENGFFRFVIYPKFIRCEYTIDFVKAETQEVKPDTPDNLATISNETDKEKIFYNHQITWKTSNSFTEALPLEVDLSQTKSETRDNKLFVRIEPKSYTRLKIHHV